MKKKVTLISLMLCLLIVLVGCSGGDKPEKTVSEFIEGMKKFDLEAMNSKINPEDRDDVEDLTSIDEEAEDEFEKIFLDYIKSNASKITYEINESKVDGDKAIVNVDFKYVDGAPLFKAVFEEYMKEAFGLALTNIDEEISDEEIAEIFTSAMEKQKELIEETYVEKTLDVDCIKIEDQWYINNPSDELLDVVMSNMLTTIEEMDDAFDFEEDDFDDSSTTEEDLLEEDINIIVKGLGDEVELKTLNISVKDIEEKDTLTPEYGEEISAKEGTKFVVVGMEATNTTKAELAFPDTFSLIDNEEREFSTYSDGMFALDDSLEYEDLSPSIKEEGHLVYQVPEDSTNYYMIMRKADSQDAYKIILK